MRCPLHSYPHLLCMRSDLLQTHSCAYGCCKDPPEYPSGQFNESPALQRKGNRQMKLINTSSYTLSDTPTPTLSSTLSTLYFTLLPPQSLHERHQAQNNQSSIWILEVRLEQRSTCVRKLKKAAQHILNLAGVDGHNGAVAEHLALRLSVDRREDKRVLVRPHTHGTLLNPTSSHDAQKTSTNAHHQRTPQCTPSNNKEKKKEKTPP